jgi:hypothetical protein
VFHCEKSGLNLFTASNDFLLNAERQICVIGRWVSRTCRLKMISKELRWGMLNVKELNLMCVVMKRSGDVFSTDRAKRQARVSSITCMFRKSS